MAVLSVGAGQAFQTIASAIAASHDGDVIQVQAGTYTNDFAEITTKITLEGVGGTVNMVATGPIPNGKAILLTDTDVTIDHFAFSGATVNDGNGAGIRYQGGNLTITNSYFHDNQNGLLAASDPTGSITIDNSEFSHNGTGDGYTHNLYVGTIGTLTVDGSYFHDAVVGHEIKSRAATTTITNSRIEDGPNGTASYGIDLPNGGNVLISNDVIEKGPNSQNPIMISFGEEGSVPAGSSLRVANDTLLYDKSVSSSSAAIRNTTSDVATVTGDRIYGLASNQVLTGTGTVSGASALTTEPALDASQPQESPSSTADQKVLLPTAASPPGAPDDGASVFRFFDTGSGTQFLTASPAERASILATRPDLISEGVGFGAAAAADATGSPVFRFFDTVHGTHFFTSSTAERDQVAATRADLRFEGVAFDEYAAPEPGALPVYRFFDSTNGTHFFTDSASELASILGSRPDLVAEGVAFYAPQTG